MRANVGVVGHCGGRSISGGFERMSGCIRIAGRKRQYPEFKQNMTLPFFALGQAGRSHWKNMGKHAVLGEAE